jgi:hypothetical protein
MADLAAGDVTYTENVGERNIRGTRRFREFSFTLAFGDGAKTYPTGGVPLVKANLGCPQAVIDLEIVDQSATGIVWKYDKTNVKLRAYLNKDPAAAGGADIPLPEAGGGTYAVPTSQSLKVRVLGY